MFEPSFLAIPQRQSEYGFGSNYQYAYANNLYDVGDPNRRANIWGPRFEGQPVPQYDSPIDTLQRVSGRVRPGWRGGPTTSAISSRRRCAVEQ